MEGTISEIRYQVGEAWKGTYNPAENYNVAAVVQDATGLGVYRSLKSGNVGHALTETEWWLCIIDLSAVHQEAQVLHTLNTRVEAAENNRVTKEGERIEGERSREAAETLRVSAEDARGDAEIGRVSSETSRERSEVVRVAGEETRENKEIRRQQNETMRDQAESNRAAAENSRVSAESQRHEQATADHNTAASDHAKATTDHDTAGIDHARAEEDHTLAAGDHTTAGTDHEHAAADHSTAGTDHARAEEDHTLAAGDHTTAGTDHEQAAADHSTASTDHAQYLLDHEAVADKVDKSDLENGNVVPLKSRLAENLDSWENRNSLSVNDEFSDIVRTTAGDQSIDSGKPAVVVSIVPQTDFSASALKATGFNLLRNAAQVGTGYYFIVPAMSFGSFGTALQPNGVLFTDSEEQNLTPTVYFKPLSQGVPASETDGEACGYTDSNGYRFYTTAQAGYMIVSGITLANTCAHIGWSRRYDEYIAVDDANDASSTISLTSIMSALHSSVQKMLTLGTLVCDRVDFGATEATWTRAVSLVNIKAYDADSETKWTDTPDDVEEGQEQTYTHSATISDIKLNGLAALLADGTPLKVEGTTISYSDNTEHAAAADIKFELAKQETGTVNLSPSFIVEDWGLEILVDASGTAVVTAQYAQNYPDALAGIASVRMAEAEDELLALAEAYSRETQEDSDMEELPTLCGQPYKLYAEGSPAEALVPSNWIQLADGGYNWNGAPSAVGQEYIDTLNGVKYEAVWDDYAKRTLRWLAV